MIIASKWKKSFNSGYKTQEIFTKIIRFIQDITLDKMKENTAKLINIKDMLIYKEEASKLASMISEILEKKQVENY